MDTPQNTTKNPFVVCHVVKTTSLLSAPEARKSQQLVGTAKEATQLTSGAGRSTKPMKKETGPNSKLKLESRRIQDPRMRHLTLVKDTGFCMLKPKLAAYPITAQRGKITCLRGCKRQCNSSSNDSGSRVNSYRVKDARIAHQSCGSTPYNTSPNAGSAEHNPRQSP